MSCVERARFVNNPVRIGVFGGTFDPIHLGHLAIAQTAMAQAHLDRILFVIAANPPHKPGEQVTPAEIRVAMTAAAIAHEPRFEISRLEVDRPGKSYSAETLKLLHESLPDARLYFIVGYDSAVDMPRWYRPEEIVCRARVLIAPRPEISRPLPPLLEGCSEMLDMPEFHLASSEIRARIHRGETLEDALPAPVTAMIQEKGLYQQCR